MWYAATNLSVKPTTVTMINVKVMQNCQKWTAHTPEVSPFCVLMNSKLANRRACARQLTEYLKIIIANENPNHAIEKLHVCPGSV